MSIIRNGETLYTIDEVDEMLKLSIKKNAKQVAKEIKNRIHSNNKMYV